MKIEVIPRFKTFEKLVEAHPPVKANKFIPEWFKSMKPGTELASFLEEFHGIFSDNAHGARKCPAIRDLMFEGFIIPLWGKMYMGHEYDDEGNKIQTHYGMTSSHALRYDFFGSHFEKQVGDMDVGLAKIGNAQRILKVESPYKIILPKGYNLMYIDPFYHFRKEIKVLPGLVEADKWGYVTFPFSIEEPEFVLPAGTPLIQAIPYKRNTDKLDLVVRNATDEEYENNKSELFQAENDRVNYKSYPDKLNTNK
tara:strand:+ start:9874 stop:10632 length:759 start_codon:yes stop_codon:yes gene_type:complete